MDFNLHYFGESNVPEFIMLIGIPGSGKSTWISQKNKNNKYIIVSPDEIRRDLVGDVSDQSQNSKVWQLTKDYVINALASGKNVILDSIMTSSKNRTDFIKDLPKSNLRAKVFYIDPEISKERISKDIELGKDRSNVPSEVIDNKHNELMKDIKISNKGLLDLSKLEDEGFQIIGEE